LFDPPTFVYCIEGAIQKLREKLIMVLSTSSQIFETQSILDFRYVALNEILRTSFILLYCIIKDTRIVGGLTGNIRIILTLRLSHVMFDQRHLMLRIKSLIPISK
jgi:hypothetical protein